MASQRLRYLVYLILLRTWASESVGEVVQAAVHEMSGENNVLGFIEEAVAKLGVQADVNHAKTISDKVGIPDIDAQSPNKQQECRTGDVVEGAEVIFEVQLKGNGKIVTPVNSIVYNEVIVNRGGGYNPKTGRFTTPSCGVYFFSYSSLPGRGKETDVALMKNGRKVSYIHSVLAHNTSQISMRNIILELHKCDEVWVELLTGNLWSEAGSLSFQGFLLARS